MENSKVLNRDFLFQLQASYEAGFKKCAETLGLIKPYISLREAQKIYGRSTVDRWISEGLIHVIKDGTTTSKCRIRREEIELVASMSNRASWYANIASEFTCE